MIKLSHVNEKDEVYFQSVSAQEGVCSFRISGSKDFAKSRGRSKLSLLNMYITMVDSQRQFDAEHLPLS
jgi:hypothetical protein